MSDLPTRTVSVYTAPVEHQPGDPIIADNCKVLEVEAVDMNRNDDEADGEQFVRFIQTNAGPALMCERADGSSVCLAPGTWDCFNVSGN